MQSDVNARYYMTPDMLEAIVVEQTRIASGTLRRLLATAPGFGALLGLAYGTYGAYLKMQPETSAQYTWLGISFGVAVVTVFGFVAGVIGRSDDLNKIRSKIRRAPPGVIGLHELSFDDDGCRVASGIATSQFAWCRVDAIRVTLIAVHFMWRGKPIYSVPRTAFGSEEALDDLLRLGRQHGIAA